MPSQKQYVGQISHQYLVISETNKATLKGAKKATYWTK